MRCRCPACGAESALDALVAHADASWALNEALSMTPVGRRLVQYLGLFRPAERVLTWDRVAKILGELLPMIEAGSIEHNHRTWPAPHAYWIGAIEQMLAKRETLILPLKSHGYLLKIIAGMGNSVEARAEREKENNLRQGGVPASVVNDMPPADGDDEPPHGEQSLDSHDARMRAEQARQNARADFAALGQKFRLKT